MVSWLPVPGMPKFVDGVIDVRGELVPVVDLAARLGVPPRPPSIDDHLVVVRAAGRLVALRVERADEVVALRDESVSPVPTVASAHVAGVARLSDGLFLVTDLDRFLSEDEQEAIARAMKAEVLPG